MELKIMSPQEGGFVKEIKWNNEELKAEIAEKMQEYKSLVFTEETMKDAKADRAKLNKLKTALIEEPIRLIDQQIKEVEERKKLEKKGQILEYYEEHIGALKGVLPFEKLFKQEYLNASKSMKSITEEMSGAIQRVNNDLDTIEGFGSKYELQIKDVYLRTLDLSSAMQEKARLEEVERRLAEKKEEERKTQEIAAKAAASKQSEERSESEKIEETRAAEQKVEEKEPQTSPEPQLFQMDFRIWGTREQIMGLRQYLIDHNIRFGKVE